MRHAGAYVERCIELAAEALDAGDDPFGSVLVSRDGRVLAEERNRVVTMGDPTAHPEIGLARWAAAHLSPSEREAATVYTSGEHCPMCSAAHGWVGLGRIVYVFSSAQLVEWLQEMGLAPAPVRPVPIQDIVPAIRVEGPIAGLEDRMRELHLRHRSRRRELA